MQKEFAALAEAYYQGEQGKRYRAEHLSVASKEIFDAIARQRARKIQAYIRAGQSVFEYGVGSGFNLAKLSCLERAGYDVFDNAHELDAHEISFYARIEEIPDERFDVALCMHTLEHVLRPWEVLAQIRRLLKTRGRLIVSVPFEIERSHRSFDPSNLHQHLYSWNVQTLGMLLTKANMTIEEIGVRPFGYDRFTARLVRGTEHDWLYRVVHWALLCIRPHFEIMAICRKNE